MNYPIRTLAFFVISVIITVALAKNTAKWAIELQKIYSEESKKINDGQKWEGPWRTTFFKMLIIFFGVMAMVGAFVLCFS
jgi:hypothetical protein